MEARYKRSNKQWSSHLKNTKSIIEAASRQIAKPDEVIVLGSGLLLDVPIDFLSNYFKRVFLVDVVHLKKTQHLIRQYDNVEMIEHDVTGFSDQLAHFSENNFKIIPSIPNFNAKTSLVISANMLSQISLSPMLYAEKKYHLNQEKQERLAVDIMKAHIKMLSALSTQVCLISDYRRTYRDDKQQIEEVESALKGIVLAKPDKTWIWEIAPKGELGKNISMNSLVYAYLDFKT